MPAKRGKEGRYVTCVLESAVLLKPCISTPPVRVDTRKGERGVCCQVVVLVSIFLSIVITL